MIRIGTDDQDWYGPLGLVRTIRIGQLVTEKNFAGGIAEWRQKTRRDGGIEQQFLRERLNGDPGKLRTKWIDLHFHPVKYIWTQCAPVYVGHIGRPNVRCGSMCVSLSIQIGPLVDKHRIETLWSSGKISELWKRGEKGVNITNPNTSPRKKNKKWQKVLDDPRRTNNFPRESKKSQ